MENAHKEQDILGPEHCILKETSKLTPRTIVAQNGGKEYVVKFIASMQEREYDLETLELYYSHFLKQYQMLSKIKMAYVPKILFSNIGSEYSYIVTEKLEGETLEAFILKNSQDKYQEMNMTEVLTKAHCIVKTLFQLNLWNSKPAKWWFGKATKGTLYHRNISLANIFLTQNAAYLLGWSKIKDAEKGNKIDIQTQNMFYQPPEYLFTGGYTSKSDIFSLGICLHLWLTGYHPYLPNLYPFTTKEAASAKLEVYLRALENKEHTICIAETKIASLIESFISPDVDKRLDIEEAFFAMQKLIS